MSGDIPFCKSNIILPVFLPKEFLLQHLQQVLLPQELLRRQL